MIFLIGTKFLQDLKKGILIKNYKMSRNDHDSWYDQKYPIFFATINDFFYFYSTFESNPLIYLISGEHWRPFIK